eukprot:285255_1
MVATPKNSLEQSEQFSAELMAACDALREFNEQKLRGHRIRDHVFYPEYLFTKTYKKSEDAVTDIKKWISRAQGKQGITYDYDALKSVIDENPSYQAELRRGILSFDYKSSPSWFHDPIERVIMYYMGTPLEKMPPASDLDASYQWLQDRYWRSILEFWGLPQYDEKERTARREAFKNTEE